MIITCFEILTETRYLTENQEFTEQTKALELHLEIDL